MLLLLSGGEVIAEVESVNVVRPAEHCLEANPVWPSRLSSPNYTCLIIACGQKYSSIQVL
jgi:hypothetical protein